MVAGLNSNSSHHTETISVKAPFWAGYNREPVGNDNPYYMCVGCKKTDPEINGDIDNHHDDCTEVKQMLATSFIMSTVSHDTVIIPLDDIQATQLDGRYIVIHWTDPDRLHTRYKFKTANQCNE